MSIKRFLVLGSSLALASCSAAIIGAGTSQSSVVHGNSKQAEIVKVLGAPTESINLRPAVLLSDVLKSGADVHTLVAAQYVRQPDGSSLTVWPDALAVTQESYRCTCRIGGGGEAVANDFEASGMTLGLMEIVLVPMAIKDQVARGQETHLVTVWYDESQTALAYRWVSIKN
jgi:hypothetical protein